MKNAAIVLVLACSAGCASNVDEGAAVDGEETSVAASALVASTGWQPLADQGLNNCDGETTTFTGMHFTAVRTTTDARGGMHVSVTERIRATAVGNVSGSRYVTNEGGHVSEHLLSSGVYTFTAPFRGTIISQDRDVANMSYSLLLHVTINPNGTVTSSIDTFKFVCR